MIWYLESLKTFSFLWTSAGHVCKHVSHGLLAAHSYVICTSESVGFGAIVAAWVSMVMFHQFSTVSLRQTARNRQYTLAYSTARSCLLRSHGGSDKRAGPDDAVCPVAFMNKSCIVGYQDAKS
eukprot:2504527-Amphidinium_carterae.2